MAKQQWEIDLENILENKGLSKDLFSKTSADHTLESDINEHAKWTFNHIYSIPYPNDTSMEEIAIYYEEFGIARYIHGIQHVSHVAIFTQAFINLYRRYNDPDALKLTEEDTKLLKIAALFHDSAREGEEKDNWEHESAIFLYLYFTRVLNADKEKAKLIAEATANKDIHPNEYFEIEEDADGKITWKSGPVPYDKETHKNIYQKIIHDADSLEIIRARPHYKAEYLDFYKEIASKNKQAKQEMSHLITEARSLIHNRGDAYGRMNLKIKIKHENEDGYIHALNGIDENLHPIVHALGKNSLEKNEANQIKLIDSTPYQKELGLTNENLKAALREGKVFARGIATPSGIPNNHHYASIAELEISKEIRTKGIATRTSKANQLEKEGNLLRSISMLGYGAGVFSSAGFLIIDIIPDNIAHISSNDAGSDFGKKISLQDLILNQNSNNKDSLLKKSANDLLALHEKLQMGGKSTIIENTLHISTHNEIIYNITRCDAIYYTQDPNLGNENTTADAYPSHQAAPLLQAIFIRKQYEQQYDMMKQKYIDVFGKTEGLEKFTERFGDKKILPIIEYSGIHNTIKIIPESELTDEKIISLWADMCGSYIEKELEKTENEDIHYMTTDDIKLYSMYRIKELNPKIGKQNNAADTNYSAELRVKINAAIKEKRQLLIKKQKNTQQQKIMSGEVSALSDEAFLVFLRNPDFLMERKNQIQDEINNCLSNENIFSYNDLGSLGKSQLSSVKNINDIIDNDSYHKNIFRDSTAMKAYILSTIINLPKENALIKDQANKFIEDIILNFNNQIKNNTFFSPDIGKNFDILLGLSKMLMVFDIDSPSLQLEIDNFIEKFLYRLNWAFKQFDITLTTYTKYIDKIQNFNLLNPENLSLAKRSFQSIKNIFLKDKLDSMDVIYLNITLSTFMKLSSVLGYDAKKELIDWIHQAKNLYENTWPFKDDKILKLIVTLFPLSASNLDLFHEIVSNIHYHLNDINKWIDTISNLERYTPNSTFDQNQLSIIENRWLTICEQYIKHINHMNPLEKVKSLTSTLDDILSAKLTLPTDSLTSTLNETLNTLSQQDVAQLTPKEINSINQLHGPLPHQDEAKVHGPKI